MTTPSFPKFPECPYDRLIVPGCLYDRVQFHPDWGVRAHFQTFDYPVGSIDPWAGRPRSYVDTNMVVGGMLPAPHDYLVNGVILLFQPACDPSDVEHFVKSFMWELRLLERTVLRAPGLVSAVVGVPEAVLLEFGKGSWLDENSNAPADLRPLNQSRIGWKLEYPVCIPPMYFFGIQFFGQSFRPRALMDFYVLLCGLRRQEVA